MKRILPVSLLALVAVCVFAGAGAAKLDFGLDWFRLIVSGDNTVAQNYLGGAVENGTDQTNMWRLSRPPHSNDLRLDVTAGSFSLDRFKLETTKPPVCNANTAGTFAVVKVIEIGKPGPAFCDGESWVLIDLGRSWDENPEKNCLKIIPKEGISEAYCSPYRQ